MFYVICALTLPVIVGLVAVAYMLWLAGVCDSYEKENRE